MKVIKKEYPIDYTYTIEFTRDELCSIKHMYDYSCMLRQGYGISPVMDKIKKEIDVLLTN